MKNYISKIFKSIAVVGLMTLTLSITKSDFSHQTEIESQTETAACKYGQCKATAKSTGLRCKHCVSNEGDSYCYQHK